MILSLSPAASVILSTDAESMILSAGSAKQQSAKSCSGKCGDNGGGRGSSGGGKRFDLGSGDNDYSDDSNGNGDVDGDRGNGDSGKDDCAKSIMLSAGGVVIIILSAPSFLNP
jgi:hypothetical protein